MEAQATDSATLAGLSRRVIAPLSLSVLLGGVAAVLLIIQMGALAHIIADLALRHGSFSGEGMTAGLFLLAALLRALCQGSADSAGDWAALHVTSSLRLEILEHLYHVGPVGLIGQETGRIATSLSEGIEAIGPYIARFMPRAAAMVTTPLLILACVLPLDRWSFLVLALTGPLVPFFMAIVGYSAQSIMDRKWTELLLLGASFLDMLQGLTSLRLFGRAHDAIRLVASMADAHRKSTMAVMRVAFLTSAVLEFFASLSIAIVAVSFGIRLLGAKASFETAFFILLLAPEYFMPLRIFSASYHDRQNAQSAFIALSDLFKLPELCQRLQHEESTTLPLPETLTAVKSLRFEHVSAQYQTNGAHTDEIFSDLCLDFPVSQLNILTGPSGSGKTTIFRLILGMMPPSHGRIILITDDHAEISPDDVKIGWVPQSPFLIAGSVADNLRLAAPAATEADLWHVLEEAEARSFITALPEGLNTILSERGAPLSMGQIRRLALARALLRQPQILLCDEPTADLDHDNAAMITQAINRAVPDRLVLVISHREDMQEQARQNGKIWHLDKERITS